MMTLIATGHRELGSCNSYELEKIIETIAPDVIFEEIPHTKFDNIYANTLTDSLESKTIKLYLTRNVSDHFPVDLDVPSETERILKMNYARMTSYFEAMSVEYRNVWEEFLSAVNSFGFPFLNSTKCQELLSKKSEIEIEIVKSSRDEELTSDFEQWQANIEARQNAMVRNIYRYFISKEYRSGLFLVGAEHSKDLKNKITDFEKKNNLHLNWNFDFFKR